MSWEEKKQRDSELRKRKRRQEKLRQEISSSKKEMEGLAAEMSLPEVCSDYAKVRDLGDRLSVLESRIAEYTDELETLELLDMEEEA